MAKSSRKPWFIRFSYGKALQHLCPNITIKVPENITSTQQAIYAKAKAKSRRSRQWGSNL